MPRRPLIFIASPVTSPDPALVQSRLEAAARFGAWVQEHEGKCVFVAAVLDMALRPHLTQAPSPEQWRADLTNFMEPAEACYILCLPGWEQSSGVALEMDVARELGKPVMYFDVAGQTFHLRPSPKNA